MVSPVSAGITRRALLAALTLAPALASATGRRAVSLPVPPAPPDELVRLAGTCVVTGWHGRAVPREVRLLLRQGALGGVLLTNENFAARSNLQALTASLAALAPEGSKPLVSADQEGGPVAHLSPPLSRFPSMTSLGLLDDEDLTRRLGAALGGELRAQGVTFDLAPVLDVRTSSNNTVVLGRVFGRDPQRVARHGRALIDGLLSAGVLACAKHFPGHGDTVVDSHVGLPRVTHALARLDAVELVPFRACASRVSAVMVAHILYTAIDATAPSSLSRAVVEGLLRQRVGFGGVAITDDLQMAAIRAMHPIERAAELALRAGNDLVLIAHSPALALRAIEHLARAAEHDPALRARLEQSSARIARLRAQRDSLASTASTPVDPAAVVREVSARVLARRAVPGRPAARDPTRQR